MCVREEQLRNYTDAASPFERFCVLFVSVVLSRARVRIFLPYQNGQRPTLPRDVSGLSAMDVEKVCKRTLRICVSCPPSNAMIVAPHLSRTFVKSRSNFPWRNPWTSTQRTARTRSSRIRTRDRGVFLRPRTWAHLAWLEMPMEASGPHRGAGRSVNTTIGNRCHLKCHTPSSTAVCILAMVQCSTHVHTLGRIICTATCTQRMEGRCSPTPRATVVP